MTEQIVNASTRQPLTPMQGAIAHHVPDFETSNNHKTRVQAGNYEPVDDPNIPWATFPTASYGTNYANLP